MMRYRLLPLLLTFALLLSPAAAASQALGWELVQTETALGPGVTMTARTFWGDSVRDYRAEHFVTYTPGQGSLPVVCYGATVPSTASVTAMAKTLESWGGRVLAGANGDYFVMATGVPLGMVVTEGVLRSSSSYHYAVGFLPDGSVFVGKPELSLTASFSGYDLAVTGGYNKGREAQGGYVLYSPDFGASARASGTGVNVVLRPVTVPEDYAAPAKPEPFLDPEPQAPELREPELPAGESGEGGEAAPEAQAPEEDAYAIWQASHDAWQAARELWQQEMDQWAWDLAWSVTGFESLPPQLRIGQSLTCVVESVGEQSGNVTLPPDRLVLSVDTRGDGFLIDCLRGLAIGQQVTLRADAADLRWAQAVSALGAFAHILQNGAVPDGLEEAAAPRTALGVKPDGQVVLYTIDGRRTGHSAGASARQVARRLAELGCTEAVLFDGGGSTAFGATGALDASFSLQSRPSEGSQRAVTNALFFVSPLTPTGALGSLYIQPHSALMLSGASVPLWCQGIDTGWYPMGDGPVEGVSYTVDGPGRVENGAFVAGDSQGVATVTAHGPDKAEGTALMSVVSTPDTITVSAGGGGPVSELNLDPGQRVDLTASAKWYKLDLLADDSCFTWTLDEAVGTVDAQGVLTAGPRAAAGALWVAAGERAVAVPVTVDGHVRTLDGFEGDTPALQGERAQAECSAQQVKLGRQSLRVRYPLEESATLTWGRDIEPGESCLGFWFLGDADAPTLTFRLLLADGETAEAEVCPDGREGWQHVLVPIPENTVALTALTVTPGPEAMDVDERGFAQFYLDHLTSANGPVEDRTPPTASLRWEEGVLTATLSDNTDKSFDPANLALTRDGWPVAFTLEGSALTAPVELSEGEAHRLSLELADASGNRARVTLELPGDPEAPPPFTDIEDHWARDYIIYLARQGVTNGRQSGDGAFVFDPQTDITRGEFAAMLARWLHADLAAWEGAALPFADADAVPAWAAPAVAFLADAGIMAGSLEPDGLYANAGDSITRAQAMTMLGRVLQRGSPVQEEPFDDDPDIPAWAREHVYLLAGRGVVSGFAGLVRPQDPITRCEVAKLLTALW